MEDKKTERKRKRFAARLQNSKGIKCIETPGPNIIICNAGQATGLEKSAIFKLIEYKGLDIIQPKFVAEKGQTHSYLVFDSTTDAEIFYNSLNGNEKLNVNIGALYMNFVEKVPDTDILCPHGNPNGLILLCDFITSAEEQEFLKKFDWATESSNLKNRQVRHYGYEFRYGSNDVDLTNPLEEKIPEVCDVLWDRLKEFGYILGKPDQLTVNKYCPGQGIPQHVDKHSPFGDTILSLSLGSDIVMDWKHHTGKYVPLLVEARSLLIMQGEARYDWQHGIQPRTWDPVIEHRSAEESLKTVRVLRVESVPRSTRLSLTFRWTRRGPCRCGYGTLCDSAQASESEELQDELASALEELHVHQVYEQIAGHFSSTRHKPWPGVVRFLEGAAPGSVVLDLGAGNGKNMLPRSDIIQIAGERSWSLVRECRSLVAGAECVRADLLHAPFRPGIADVVLCIAVIHHFSTQTRRLQALSSLHSLLRKGGRALITVWAKDQTKSNYLKNKQDQVCVDVSESQLTVGGVTLPVHENRTQFKHKDLLVPWKLRKLNENKLSNQPDNTLLRYYHVFDENELDELCKNVGFDIENSFYEEGNWCVICNKK